MRSRDHIAVVGAGSWGTALAEHLAHRDHPVRLWAFEREVAADINERRENSVFLPGVRLHRGIQADTSLGRVLRGTSMVVFVVPSHVARDVLGKMRAHLSEPLPFVSATKGVEAGSLNLPTQVALDVLGSSWLPFVGALSGPSFAREVALGLPAAVSVAMGDPRLAVEVAAALSSPSFRVYTNPDVIGLQVGGAVKNVLAIAAGISDGLGFGANARAALVTRGLAEMRRLGVAMGARPETFAGLSGLGDLVLTCTGDLSRNRTVGMKLGSGAPLQEILASMRMVAEGVHTSEAVVRLADRWGVDMPISRQAHAIIHRGKDPREAFQDLMSRGLKDEATDLPHDSGETGEERRAGPGVRT